MLNGLLQHFLILKFLLILQTPEAWSVSHLCKHTHRHSPCPNMFSFWAYFKFPRFIYSRCTQFPTDKKQCDVCLWYIDEWAEVKKPHPLSDTQLNLGEVTTVPSHFYLITGKIIYIFLSPKAWMPKDKKTWIFYY